MWRKINSDSIQTYFDNIKFILIDYIFFIIKIISNVYIKSLWCGQGLVNLLAIPAKCKRIYSESNTNWLIMSNIN